MTDTPLASAETMAPRCSAWKVTPSDRSNASISPEQSGSARLADSSMRHSFTAEEYSALYSGAVMTARSPSYSTSRSLRDMSMSAMFFFMSSSSSRFSSDDVSSARAASGSSVLPFFSAFSFSVYTRPARTRKSLLGSMPRADAMRSAVTKPTPRTSSMSRYGLDDTVAIVSGPYSLKIFVASAAPRPYSMRKDIASAAVLISPYDEAISFAMRLLMPCTLVSRSG